eukprot:792695_1
MIISREKDNGFNVKEAFEKATEKALKEKHTYWHHTDKSVEKQDKDDETSFWSKLTSCFQSPLKCNPGVQIDFRGSKVKLNPLHTEFIMHPKSTSIPFEAKEGLIEFEFIRDTNEKKNEEKQTAILDTETQYLIVQVLDNE